MLARKGIPWFHTKKDKNSISAIFMQACIKTDAFESVVSLENDYKINTRH
jgi:hypothetical protein